MHLNQIIKKTIRVSGITAISRILGYIRDIIIASRIGTGLLNDIFIATFKIVNLFRAIFAEGAFSAAFIPIFLQVSTKEGEKSAMRFAAEAQSLLTIVLIIFTIFMIIFMPIVIMITTPGFVDIPYAFDLAIHLGRILFPYIIFISLAAFYGGIMNSLGIFSPFAATSIILNIIMIIVALCDQYATTPAHALTYGSLIAGIFEFLWMLYFAKKYHVLVPFCRPRMSALVKKTLNKMLPNIINFGVVQINILVSMIIASLVTDGMSYIYYADRISQFPIALIGTAIGTVVLPALSKAFELKQSHKIKTIIYHSFGMILFFSIPSAFGILYLSDEIIRTLFMRGHFTELSVINTAGSLMAFSLGIPAFSMNRLFTTIFYSHHNTHTPMKISIITISINLIISVLLLQSMQHIGISIATSVSAWLNVICFIIVLKRKNQFYITTKILKEIIKILIASAIMLCAIYAIYHLIYHQISIQMVILPNWINNLLTSILPLTITTIIGIIVYSIASYLLKSDIYNLLLHSKNFDLVGSADE